MPKKKQKKQGMMMSDAEMKKKMKKGNMMKGNMMKGK